MWEGGLPMWEVGLPMWEGGLPMWEGEIFLLHNNYTKHQNAHWKKKIQI